VRRAPQGVLTHSQTIGRSTSIRGASSAAGGNAGHERRPVIQGVRTKLEWSSRAKKYRVAVGTAVKQRVWGVKGVRAWDDGEPDMGGGEGWKVLGEGLGHGRQG